MENLLDFRSRRLAFLLALGFVITIGNDLPADELQLKNGDFISGQIVSMDEATVVIQTSYGVLTIDRSQVLSGSFSATETTPDESLVVELLFDGDPDIPPGSPITISEHGIQRSAGVDGKAESAIRSTGNGAYLEITDTPELDIADELTLSFWIFPREAERLQYVLSKWNVSANGKATGKFAVGTRYAGLYVYLMDTAGNYHLQSFDNLVPATTWTHLAVVFDAGRLSVYQDGSLAGQSDLPFKTLAESAAPLYVMTAKASNADTWSFYNLNGMLDNLRIYSRALTETEIAALAGEL